MGVKKRKKIKLTITIVIIITNTIISIIISIIKTIINTNTNTTHTKIATKPTGAVTDGDDKLPVVAAGAPFSLVVNNQETPTGLNADRHQVKVMDGKVDLCLAACNGGNESLAERMAHGKSRPLGGRRSIA